MTTTPPVPVEELPDKFDGSVIQLIYGAGGTGKTEYAGSIGENGIVLSIGEGHLTLSSPDYRNRNPKRPKISYIRETYDPKTGLFTSAEAFDKVTDYMDWFLTTDLDTLALDDSTFLSQFARNKGMEFNSSRISGGADSLAISRSAGFLNADIGDYGSEMKIIMWLLATQVPQFKEKKKNLILVAHERHIFKKAIKIGGEDTLERIIPAFTGKTFPDAVQVFFDFVWRFQMVNGVKVRALTMGTTNALAKSRWRVVPEQWENPNFLVLLNKLMEK